MAGSGGGTLALARHAAPGGVLDAALNAADPWMRAAAARLLAHAPRADAAGRLEHMVVHDGSPRVRAAAILAAYQVDAMLGHRLAQQECQKPALPDVDRVRMLVETGDVRHVEYLVRLFDTSRSPELRAQISRGLTRLAGGNQDPQRLLTYLQSAVRDPALRDAVARLTHADE
jgi:hypothetical protein